MTEKRTPTRKYCLSEKFLFSSAERLLPTHEAIEHRKHHQHYNQEQNRCHREFRVVQVLKAVVEEVLEHVDVFVGVGAADEEDFSEALEGVDEGKDDGKEHGIPHLGRGDIVELLPARGPVQVGGGVLLLRDSDQTRQEQNHAVAGILPKVQEQHHAEGRRPAQPVHKGQAQGGGNAGNQAGLRKEQLHQDNRADNRHDVREQEHGLQELMLVGVFLHQQGDEVGQNHDEGQGRRQKPHGVAKGQGEHAVGGHVLVVDEADEIAGSAAARGEGILDYQHKGDGVE